MCSLQGLISYNVIRRFEKELSYREKLRKKKKEREKSYNDNIEIENMNKFEEMKLQSMQALVEESFINSSMKPRVVKNIMYQPS